jgi:glycosyltransferase involved in cell wall biosynthesis
MKVIFLNTYDAGGGAAIAAYRLHKGIQNIGIDSRMLVQVRTRDEKTVVGPNTRIGKGLGILRPDLDAMLLKCYPSRENIIFSPAVIPDRLQQKVTEYDPDVIHLHWTSHGFLRIETLKKFSKPLLWTLHDSWAFTGGCHMPFDCVRYRQSCGKCPTLCSTSDNDLSRWIWKRKNKAWKNLNLTLVAPSRWLANCAKQSSLFHNARTEVIPNGVDIQKFKPINKNVARELLNIPLNKKIILFNAINGVNDRNKGFHLLHQSLLILSKKYPDKFELLILGSPAPSEPPDFGFKTRYLGRFQDEVSIALLYSAVDAFVAPSIQENLPNTVMEALACGTPSVAFNIGGMPDLMDHERNGYLAKPFEPEDMARGIFWVLEDEERWKILSMKARQKVVKEFSLGEIASRYTKLYKEISNSLR